MSPMPPGTGHVTLVGAGPGDPGLLTVAGLRALQTADIVLHDALLASSLLNYAEQAELVDVGKRAGAHSMSQEEISALLIEHAKTGKRVVRLKGGDPFVFGRGGEEALALRAAGIPFVVIPGVTSAVAVPAYAGIPVTHRGLARSFAVVTGSEATMERPTDWAALAGMDTLVVLMGAASLPEVARRLIEAGRDPATPAASISNGTLPNQRSVIGTLATIAETVAAAELPAPLITVIGDVVSLSPEVAWREALPLAGKSVVVTRTRRQASNLRAKLEALGADVIEAPVLEIHHRADGLVTDERVASRWDWIAFSSQNGVDAFFEAFNAAGRDARSLSTTLLAAIGPATAVALSARGLIADFTPTTPTGECFASELPRVNGARVLLPAGSLSDTRLEDGLRARGAHVEQVEVYETRPAVLDAALVGRVLTADAVTFASASSAQFLRAALGELAPAATAKLCAIGPQAAAATVTAFGRVDATATEPSIDGLVAAVVEALA